MSVPAEKLDILFKDLLEQANKSSEKMNVISLDDYKKANKNKVANLNALKKYVFDFNKTFNISLELLGHEELFYLLCVYSKLKLLSNYNEYVEDFKNLLNHVGEINLKHDFCINNVKNYPNKKLKTTSLKIDTKAYSAFKYRKNRIEKIKTEIEKYDFSPPPYMNNALENIERIINKVIEYQDKPRAILSLFNIYYSDPEDLEW